MWNARTALLLEMHRQLANKCPAHFEDDGDWYVKVANTPYVVGKEIHAIPTVEEDQEGFTSDKKKTFCKKKGKISPELELPLSNSFTTIDEALDMPADDELPIVQRRMPPVMIAQKSKMLNSSQT
ncbi:hypothetical protein CEXT_377271 [Caerostris extrusa]|uniref:Uncharacterized protein n=1 Tax=Caerostris extrusa TaxID=172846 RepID=A0AAV4VND8_CAEEX|nr:hypothetical protein CEXT_377271 [Caerostris extrusa]